METYPKGFAPDHPEKLKGKNESFIVPGVNLVFKRWAGQPMVNDFGGKPAVKFEGRAMFAELAIALLAIRAGWSARWVEVYYQDGKKPYYLLDWNDSKPFSQKSIPLDSPHALRIMESIEEKRRANALVSGEKKKPYSGAWDVLAWKGERLLFIESKHIGSDAIIDNQVLWYIAAISGILSRDNFLVAQWRFDDDPVPRGRQKAFKQPSASVTRIPQQSLSASSRSQYRQ